MTAPKQYKASYTGAEIDRLLASIDSKLDSSAIRNDFLGGTDRVASAELAKTLHTQFQQVLDPNFFRDLIAEIPDNNLFTDLDKAKLDSVDNSTYKGVFLNAADRTSKLSTSGFVGKEVTFLLNDGDGLQSWDYWDTASGAWRKAKLVSTDEIANQTFPTVATGVIASYNRTERRVGKFVVYGTKTTEFQSFEFLVGTNGVDTYLVAYGEIGNAQLFGVDATLTGNTINVRVTTLTTGVTIAARRLTNF